MTSRTLWFSARARNALRRYVLIVAVSGATFVATLVALVLVPHDAPRPRAASRLARQDTVPLAAAQARAALELSAADSALATARGRAEGALAAATVDTLPPALVARRDSLTVTAANIGRLLARAANAPLPTSYRALGEARGVNDDPRVRALLDSLTGVERQREAFGAVGGVDPIFVALTARAGAIGRSIQAIAESRRAELRRQIAALKPAAPSAPSPAQIAADTIERLASLERARVALDSTTRLLRLAQRNNREVDRTLEAAREAANVAAPPLAMLTAALVLGAVFGFGASLGGEIRRPRVADAREAEHVAGARVLAVIRPRVATPERARRRADRLAPPLLDTHSDSYRLLYLHLAATGSTLPVVTVTGDEPAIVATVATNIAAAAAHEARSTLLVDSDLAAGAVAGVLLVHPEPGLAAVIAGRRDWAAVIVTTTIGRDRALDVVPAGRWRGARLEAADVERIRRDLARTARRYDLTVLVAPSVGSQQTATSLLPAPDVVLCARVAETPLAEIRASADALRRAGTRVRGVVLWDAEEPQIAPRTVIDAAARAPAVEEEVGVGEDA